MKTYVSYSSVPSIQGKYFYNNFFSYYNLDSVYIPKIVSFELLESELELARKTHKGISVSMPFKKSVIQYLDYIDLSVQQYQSCNTIVNCNKKFYGYNTDIFGVIYSCSFIKPFSTVAIYGNGCMGKIFYQYLTQNKYVKVSIFSRSLNNWEQRHSEVDTIINCTGLGTINDHSPVSTLSKKVKVVIDLSIKANRLTELSKKVSYISGQDFYKRQFMHQFKYYTGLDIDVKLYDRFLKNK